jgi:hypothetical protein
MHDGATPLPGDGSTVGEPESCVNN